MPVDAQTPTFAREFTQRFRSTARGARLARRLTVQRLDAWGVPETSELSQAAALVVAELAANAATHGRVPGRDFALRVALDRAELRVEVSDTRGERTVPTDTAAPPPPDLATSPPPDATPAPSAVLQESGRGLLLVAALAREWGVTSRTIGKTVWAVLAT
ncbi:ATP-binding protein [Streptomyces sp. NA04227]|uniref:ATP-binding protein n=1 Tax=Streptomyces sp. NA04227 TaxID=2742136 RepID=UPI001590F803|nr:ATP-binding protein [Streptomyces sp. NA04227]QKW07578.1 ATP-binding protein [Streptomyces sp. NA04227]